MLLSIEKLTKVYGGLKANDNVDLHVEEGEIVGLIGPNGAGKSTLFQAVGGFVTPTAGKIFFEGKDITKMSPTGVCARGIACTFQHAQLFPGISMLESVMIGAYCRTKSKSQAKKAALELIEFCGLSGKEQRMISSLNMYDRKVLELTAALATKPKLLLLDELFAGLTSTEVSTMIELIKKICGEFHPSILVVEHVLKVVVSICARTYVLDYGKIIAEGPSAELFENPLVIKAYLGEENNVAQNI